MVSWEVYQIAGCRAEHHTRTEQAKVLSNKEFSLFTNKSLSGSKSYTFKANKGSIKLLLTCLLPTVVVKVPVLPTPSLCHVRGLMPGVCVHSFVLFLSHSCNQRAEALAPVWAVHPGRCSLPGSHLVERNTTPLYHTSSRDATVCTVSPSSVTSMLYPSVLLFAFWTYIYIYFHESIYCNVIIDLERST